MVGFNEETLRNSMCELRPGQPFVVMPAVRFAVRQVVFASALYSTAVVDTSSSRLQKRGCCRRCAVLFGFPAAAPRPTCSDSCACRSPSSAATPVPSRRPIASGHAWFGPELLQPLYFNSGPDAPTHDRMRVPLPFGQHGLFEHGPLRRYSTLLTKYFPDHTAAGGLGWLHTKDHSWGRPEGI